MEVIRNLHDIKPHQQRSIVTIGNFDGVHIGHQRMLQRVIAEAKAKNVLAGVVTFEPHPIEFFKPHNPPVRLTNWREKYKALKAAGVDFVLVLSFNHALASKSAEEFVDTILIKKLAVQGVWVGDDFHFGRNREGNFTLLDKLAKMEGFCANRIETVEQEGARISSTRLREVLKLGDMAQVNQLLGRYYELSGRVQKGAQRGQQLGFPTANIKLPQTELPLAGVFVIQARSVLFEGVKTGVANIGTRPTVDGKSRWLEVFLFDFTGDLYDHRLDVEFITKLRDEKKFNSLDELKAQIQRDVESARAILRQQKA